MRRIIAVTGGSSGIGRATAKALSEKGCVVYELSRRDIPLHGVTHLKADVTDEAQVKEAIEKNFDVEAVTASHEAKKVEITSAQPIDYDKVAAVIADAGYKATGLAE